MVGPNDGCLLALERHTVRPPGRPPVPVQHDWNSGQRREEKSLRCQLANLPTSLPGWQPPCLNNKSAESDGVYGKVEGMKEEETEGGALQQPLSLVSLGLADLVKRGNIFLNGTHTVPTPEDAGARAMMAFV